MPYVNFRAQVKKVNLKPNGVKEIVLEVKDNGLDGKLDTLSQMIDTKVAAELESTIINYNLLLDARTDRPLTSYKVDERGVVSEVKQEEEQLEADLGLPPEQVPTKEEKDEIEVSVVDEFILSGLAPTYDDMTYNLLNWIERLHGGETYIKIANDENLSTGKVSELVDEYRKRVAPLAKKWDEWRKEKEQQSAPKASEELDPSAKAPERKAEPNAKGPEEETGYKDDEEEGAA
jgi:hypothetical protein